jgi:hypothetical protein
MSQLAVVEEPAAAAEPAAQSAAAVMMFRSAPFAAGFSFRTVSAHQAECRAAAEARIEIVSHG